MARAVDPARLVDEGIASVYSRLIAVSIVSVANAALVAAAILPTVSSQAVFFAWLGAIVLLSLARAAIYFRYQADHMKHEHAGYWGRISISCSMCAGILWGAGPILPIGDVHAFHWLWAFAIGGMSAGAASLHAAHLPTALSFTIPACLPLALHLLLQGSIPEAAAGIMVVAFLFTLILTASLFWEGFRQSLAIKHDAEAKAAELDEMVNRLFRETEEHKLTSEALYQSQKMEALGSLTSGFAHDFNNLLMVMMGNLDLIIRRSNQSGVQDMAHSAIAAGEAGASLISHLLAFSRKQALAPKCVNSHDALSNFQGFLKHAITGSLRVNFDTATSGAIVNIDTAHFEAALLNLVVNAKHAMPKGGLITISESVISLDRSDIEVDDVRPGKFVVISVVDEGVGMSTEALEKAFEPFYTTRAGQGGTGLGLSQVYGFARQSGGFARLSSMVGHGTCVSIFLPVVLETNVAPTDTVHKIDACLEGPGSMRPLSVLLVDDNPSVLRSLKAGLAEYGWDAVTASGGSAALAIVEGGARFDIIVSDVDMPGEIDGVELARKVGLKLPDLPILLISGASIPPGKIGDDMPFLIKPFRQSLFLEKIESLAGQSKSSDD